MRTSRNASFRYEVDMYAPASYHAESFLGSSRDAIVFHDVNAAFGIPDLVFVDFDMTVLDQRRNSGLHPVADMADVAVMICLAACRKTKVPLAPHDIARITGLSRSYLSSKILPRLRESGHVITVGRGKWVATHGFVDPVHRIATVETKVGAWRQALNQAFRHGAGADSSWV